VTQPLMVRTRVSVSSYGSPRYQTMEMRVDARTGFMPVHNMRQER
jgi:hypothetical protein